MSRFEPANKAMNSYCKCEGLNKDYFIYQLNHQPKKKDKKHKKFHFGFK